MRIPGFAAALVVAIAAGGCSSKSSTTPAPSNEGTATYFSIQVAQEPVGGTIQSDAGDIVCGDGSHSCAHAQYASSTVVTLTAHPSAGYTFTGWTGDCSGTGACTFDGAAVSGTKTVGASFQPITERTTPHADFTSPSEHGPAYLAFASHAAGALDCKSCHGPRLEGQGTAPGCSGCHAWPPHAFFLDKSYANGPAVTAECLKCHPAQANELLATTHFAWLGNSTILGQTGVGKRNLINNFCVSLPSNEGRCMQCHPSYSVAPAKDPATGAVAVNTGPMYLWGTNPSVDLTKLDCLICHADLGTSKYAKAAAPFGAASVASSGSCFPSCAANQICATTDATGVAWPDGKAYCRVPNATTEVLPALTAAATSVGTSKRNNCGFCHFNAGGGDNVKMGDLASSLTAPTREMDVHMGSSAPAAPTLCADCHVTTDHAIAGSGSLMPVDDAGRVDCTDCHGTAPHTDPQYTHHAQFIACQTCHIPTFSRALFTKMDWDWRYAADKQACQGLTGCVPFGSLKYPDGTPIAGVGGEAPKASNVLASAPGITAGELERGYDWKKGVFVYAKHVTPVYRWVPPVGSQQGTHEALARDGLQGSGTVDDPYVLADLLPAQPITAGWKIAPFKKMTGRTPAFADGSAMVAPHMFGMDSLWQTDLRGYPVVPNTLGSSANPWTEAKADAIWTGLLNYGSAVAGQLGAPVAKSAGGKMTRALSGGVHTVTVETLAPATAQPTQVYLIGAEAAFPSGVKTVTWTDASHFSYVESTPYTVNVGQPALPPLDEGGSIASTQFVAFYPALPSTDWRWAYTAMYIGLNHEVAPKISALTCANCHPVFGGSVETSRMKDLYGLGTTCQDPMLCQKY